jgi:spore coat polysaccharide biosynthesis protein SpsF (cytidylyltransferase family)
LKIPAIVQARISSIRLPGKTLMPIFGKPMLYWVLRRIQTSETVFPILAIPQEEGAEKLADIAEDLGVPVFRAFCLVSDLVRRYSLAAKQEPVVVRIPGDNPCVEPEQIDRIVRYYQSNPVGWNFITTNLDRNIAGNGYPGGLGAEVYNARYFHWMDEYITDIRYREHPHLMGLENNRINTLPAPDHLKAPLLDFSVNTQADFDWITHIYKTLGDSIWQMDLSKIPPKAGVTINGNI